ncbi:hypothetical protein MWG07_10020 [Fusobacterium necrophorum]|uniref:Uncharacterized protein n=1 Tax=Fusobacterium necrophorum TaxID=859 RepID=A0AAW6WD23_9FUSO|nr:hypothetical protein [Fusobacterium necrophorum]MDK4481527.1 hypothetical protein [Fusobacterium necrophorum]MDK4512586.1 hypothetical protein [Fusobacterium necrophorum]
MEKSKREKKEIAKAMVIAGYTYDEIEAQTGTNRHTLRNWANKEGLQEKQKIFLKNCWLKVLKEIEENKKKRLKLNTKLLNKISEQIEKEKGRSIKTLQQSLLLNEQTEQEIFELDRLERLEKVEFERMIYKDKKKEEIIQQIQQMSDEELEKLQAYFEERERNVNVEQTKC